MRLQVWSQKMPTTKQELANHLGNLDQSYTLGIVAIALFLDEATYPKLKEISSTWGPHKIPGQQIADLLRQPNIRRTMLSQYASLLSRAVIKESFEGIKSYCKGTDKVPKFEAQDWYHFARIVRNSVSHNGRIELTRADHGRLPIRWRDKTIDAGSDGQPVEAVLGNHPEIVELVAEMSMFAMDDLQ